MVFPWFSYGFPIKTITTINPLLNHYLTHY